jgi:hypothetical protein
MLARFVATVTAIFQGLVMGERLERKLLALSIVVVLDFLRLRPSNESSNKRWQSSCRNEIAQLSGRSIGNQKI